MTLEILQKALDTTADEIEKSATIAREFDLAQAFRQLSSNLKLEAAKQQSKSKHDDNDE